MSSTDSKGAGGQGEAVRQAINQYQEFIRLHPNHAEAHHRLGVAYMFAGRMVDAVQTLSRAVELNDRNPDYYNNLGLSHFYLNDFHAAHDNYAKALALNPTSADVNNNMGMVLQKLNDLAGALARFKSALEITPDEPQILHNFGIALRDAGRLEAAAAVLKKAIEKSGGLPDSYSALSAIQFSLGDSKGAVDSCWSAIRMNPLHVESHKCFKGLMLALNRAGERFDTFKWACETAPDHPLVYEQYGAELAIDGDFAAAESVLRRALSLHPNLPASLACLGRCLTELGRFDEAIDSYGRAVELAPDRPEYLEGYGQSLIRAGIPEKAAAILWDAHKSKPRRSSILGMLTVALVEADDPAVDRFVDYDNDIVSRVIPTPDGYADLAAFNETLHADLAKRHETGIIPKEQTMRGGSQIPNYLFSDPSDSVQALKRTITQVIRQYVAGLESRPDHPFLRFVNPDFRFTDAWSTILYGSGYDGSHTHNGGWLSGVYYVKVPDLPEERWASGEGCIQFGAPPDEYASEKNRTRRLVRPRPGLLVLFPSYVWHGVKPFTQEGIRHSIAFDVI